MSRTFTAHLCAHCRIHDREPDLTYCRGCLDAHLATLLDELQPRQGCDLRCKAVGLETLTSKHFRCCGGAI